MSGIHGHHDMGHTLAGWTGTAVVTAGTVLAGVGMCAASPLLLRLGGAVVVLGTLATWALHLTGWGKPSGPRPEEQWSWRVRDTTHHTDCLGCRLAGRGRQGGRARHRPVLEVGDQRRNKASRPARSTPGRSVGG